MLKVRFLVFAVSLVGLQGCAVLATSAAIGVAMGTGAPPPAKVTTVQSGDTTVTITDSLARLNCLVYFDDRPTLGCSAVSFSPVADRSLAERLALAEAAVAAAKGDSVRILPRAQQLEANRVPQTWQQNGTIVLGYERR